MRRQRRPILVLMLLMLTVGCSSVDTSATDLCKPVEGSGLTEVSQRLESLAQRAGSELEGVAPDQAAATIKQLADCLTVEESGRVMIVVLSLEGEPPWGSPNRIAVWQHDDRWRAAPFPTFDKFHSQPAQWHRLERPDRLEIVAVLRNGGTGHAGAFVLMRLETELQILWQSPPYGYLDYDLLNDNLLFATHRESSVYDEPHFYRGGCCYPTNGQVLYERQGDQFILRESRAYPSPLRAASAFAGAWNEKKLDQAAPYVFNQQTLQAMAVDPQKPETISLGLDRPADLSRVELTEAAYWDALPPEYRGPAPRVTEFVWPAEPRPLVLRRLNGQWKVVGWGRQRTD